MTGIRVLLIDDDPVELKALVRYLHKEAGFEVVPFADGQEALEHLRTARYDYTAILLDYVLRAEGMSGRQVLLGIREQHPQLPVIVFAGPDPEKGVRALSEGAYRYLQKPLDRVVLVNIIRDLAGQEAIFRRMAQDVRLMLGSDMCLAWRLDRRARRFQIVAWDGDRDLDADYRRKTFLDLANPHTEGVFEKKRPIFLSDVKDPKLAPYYLHRDYAKEQGWTSMISIPLLRQDRVIGLVDSYTREELTDKQKLDQWLKVILPPLARQAAESAWNTELSNRLQALQGLNEVLAGTFEEGTILQQILAKGLDLVGAEAGWVFRLDVNKGRLVRKMVAGILEDVIEQERELGKGITGWVAQTGEALSVPDVMNPSQEHQHLKIPGLAVRSEVAVPMRRSEQIVGVLTATSPLPKAFSGDDVSLLSSLAAQAAVAIGRADVTRHSEELGRLALTGDFHRLTGYVVEAARDLTGADVILWTMSDRSEEQGQWLRVNTCRGNIGAGYLAKARIPIVASSSLTALALDRGKPIVRRDIQDDSEESEEPRFYNLRAAVRYGWHGLMVVPLLGRDGIPLGSLSLYGTEVAKFGAAEVSLMEAFASQIVTAFENARLLQRAGGRQQDLERLVGIGEAVTREIAIGLKPLLDKVTEGACRLTGADCAAIYPYDPDRELSYDLKNVAIYGLSRSRSPKEKSRKRGLAALIRDIDELVVYDVEHGELGPVDFSRVRQPDVDRARLLKFIREEKFIGEEEVKAFVALSLKAGLSAEGKEQEVGILYLDFRQPRRFTDEELGLIRIFGNQVGSAIQVARLLQRERDLRTQAEILRQVSGTIRSREELSKITNRILDELGEIVEFKTASLQLIRGDYRTLLAGRGFDLDTANRYLLRPISRDPLIRRIVQGKEPLVLPHPTQDPDWQDRDNAPAIKSWIGVPLIHNQEVVGLLTVDHDQPGFYQGDLSEPLAAFATRVAVDMRNARIFDSAQRRIRDLDIINSVLELIGTTLETAELLQTIVTQIAQRLECTHCTIFFPQVEDGEIVLVPRASFGARSEVIWSRRFRPGDGLAGWVFQHGESLVLGNAKEDPRFVPAREEQARPRSMLVVPLKVGDQTIGVISADQDEYGWFGESERWLVEALARQTGVAIQRSVGLEGLDLVREIGNRISRADKVDDILQHIVKGAIELTNTTAGVIYLLSEDGHSVLQDFEHPRDFPHPPPRMKEGGITTRIFHTGHREIFFDIRVESRSHPGVPGEIRVNPEIYSHVRSMIGEPLKLGEKVIGVLYLNDKNPHHFTDTEVSLLSTLASQAAIAIEKARLLAERDAVYQTSLGITAQLDRNRLLRTIVERAATLVEGRGGRDLAGGFLLYDYGAKKVQIVAQYRLGEPFEGVTFGFGEGMAGRVVQAQKPMIVDDYPSWEDRVKLFDNEPWKGRLTSVVQVPVTWKKQVIGVLAVSDATGHRLFDNHDVELLQRLASQAAIAIENARLLQGVEWARQLTALYDVGVTITSQLGSREVLSSIVENANTILSADFSTLFPYDSDRSQFEPGIRKGKVEAEPSICSNTGLAARIAKEKRSVFAEDAEKEPGVKRAFIEAKKVKSFAGVPLVCKGKAVGVLFVNYSEPHSFSEQEKQTLGLLTAQSAVAIENARLFAQLDREKRERIEAIREIGFGITAGLDLEEILDKLLQRTLRLAKEASVGEIWLLDEDSGKLKVKAAQGDVGASVTDEASVGEGIVGQAAQSRQPYLARNVEDDPHFIRRLAGTQSEVAVPLLVADRIMGVLNIEHPETGAFDREDVTLLEAIANQLAIALVNASLFGQLTQAVEELKELDQRKSEFLSTVSHELRTPLTPIKSCLENTLSGMYGPLAEKQHSRLEIALASANDEARLVENLLDLVRIQEGRATLELEFSNLADVVRSVVQVFEYDAQGKSIELMANLPPEGVLGIQLDRGKIKQVLTNVIGNAIKFTPEGGTVVVSVSSDEQWAYVQIRDTGIGISVEEHERIFDRFYQVDSSLTRKVGGTGIGLSIVKEYVEMHGGKVWVESVLDKGATFTFTLPKGEMDNG